MDGVQDGNLRRAERACVLDVEDFQRNGRLLAAFDSELPFPLPLGRRVRRQGPNEYGVL